MPRKTQVPFHKTFITEDEIKGIAGVLRSGWHTMGPKTFEFEERFRTHVGARNAIAVNSCTAALHLALESIGLKQGDEVILPAITFTATAEVICYFKAKPVFADIERDTLNISPRAIEDKITCRTRAIITVDFAGQPADYDEIRKIAKKHRIHLIEDAAHTLPSFYKGISVGTLADITCFSFYATKTLSTGEGGMITTNNMKWAQRMRIMRLHGMNRDSWKRYRKEGTWFYEVVEAGFKYNTTDINAALGLAQLKKLNLMWRKRCAIAETYTTSFAKMPEIIAPAIRKDRKTSWHLYVLKLHLDGLRIDRNRFIKELALRGVAASVHFIPLYRHPFYKNRFGCRFEDYPHAEWAYERIISLPIFPGMTRAQVKQVVRAVKNTVFKFRVA